MGTRAVERPLGTPYRVTVDGRAVSGALYLMAGDGYVLLSVPRSEIPRNSGVERDYVIEDQGKRWGPFRGIQPQVSSPAGRTPRVIIRSIGPVTPEPFEGEPE
jgi:hypothetical protein